MRKLLTALGIGGYLLCSPLDSVAQHGGTAEEVPVCKSGQTLGCVSGKPRKPSKKQTNLATKVQGLEGTIGGLNQWRTETIAEKLALEQRLAGYDANYNALKKEVDALSGNPGYQALRELFSGQVTSSKKEVDKVCESSIKAYRAFVNSELERYQVPRVRLLGEIQKVADDTNRTPQQKVAEASKLKRQLEELDARHRKGKDNTAKLKTACDEAGAKYTAGVAAFEARRKELAAWVRQNLTYRPEQFTLRLNQGGFFNDEASQASTSAKVGYNTKRGWTFSLEGGLLYGEATSTSVPFGMSGERTPVGDDLQREYTEEGTRTTTQRYQNFLQLGVEKSWKFGKSRKVSLGLGVTAGVLSGEETTTENATRTLALYDNAGAAVGDSQTVVEATTTTKTLRDFMVGANAELRRKFWGNLDAALGSALLYDTELNRTLPRVYLGLGANW